MYGLGQKRFDFCQVVGKNSVWAKRHSKTLVSWCQAEVWGEPLAEQETVNSCKEEQHLWASLRSSQVVLEASGFQTWSLLSQEISSQCWGDFTSDFTWDRLKNFIIKHPLLLLYWKCVQRLSMMRKLYPREWYFWMGWEVEAHSSPWWLRQAGCASALPPLCWPRPRGRTENGITTTMASGIYSSAFPTEPFNSNSNLKQVYQASSPEYPSASRHCVRNDLSGKTTAGIACSDPSPVSTHTPVDKLNFTLISSSR